VAATFAEAIAARGASRLRGTDRRDPRELPRVHRSAVDAACSAYNALAQLQPSQIRALREAQCNILKSAVSCSVR
jgi:hypothetical protein